MSTPNIRRYAINTVIQCLFLLFDICINSFSSFARQRPSDLLILYIIQDLCLVVAFTMLLISIFSTYLFQIGLIELLYKKFLFTSILCIVYLILSIVLHTWHIKLYWIYTLDYQWNTGFHILYSIHRGGIYFNLSALFPTVITIMVFCNFTYATDLVAVFYYSLYKRAILTMADPMFYKNPIAIQKQLGLP